MSDQAASSQSAPVTQRLVFDGPAAQPAVTNIVSKPVLEDAAEDVRGLDENEIPAFLRKSPMSAPAAATSAPVLNPVEQRKEEIEVAKKPSEKSNGPRPVIAPSLDDMTVDDLKRQQEEIERKIHEKQEAEKAAVIQQIVDIVQSYKIPIDELVTALGGFKVKRKGVKAQQKYRDPVSGATWSGRGKEPLWIRGKDRDQFLMDDDEDEESVEDDLAGR